MISMKNQEICTFYHSYSHSFLQDHHPKYQENHRKKVSQLVLQEIDYKKANDGSPIMDFSIPS
jgi:hypothetical protein